MFPHGDILIDMVSLTIVVSYELDGKYKINFLHTFN